MTNAKLFTLYLMTSVIFHYASIFVVFVAAATGSTAAATSPAGASALAITLAGELLEELDDEPELLVLLSVAYQPLPFK